MDTFDTITSTDSVVRKFGAGGVGLIISELLSYALILTGLLLLITLIWGGITLMTAAGDANKMKEGYGKITAGLIGFIIVFVSFFIAQILEVALGVKFL